MSRAGGPDWCLDAKKFIVSKCDDIFDNPKTKDIELQWLEKAAEYECAAAFFLLGRKHLFGIGVEENIDKAMSYYEKAVKQDEPRACNNLGVIYIEGYHGIEKNVPKGLELYHRSAEMGTPIAMNNLGVIYFYGENGVEQDTEKGLEFYSKAAEARNAAANAILSFIYKKGKGLTKSLSKSKEYAQKANMLIEDKFYKSGAYDEIARQLYEMREYKEALIWVQKLIEADTTNTNHLDTIACVYKGLKRYDDALKYYQKAFELGRTVAAQDIEELKKLIAASKKTKNSSKKR